MKNRKEERIFENVRPHFTYFFDGMGRILPVILLGILFVFGIKRSVSFENIFEFALIAGGVVILKIIGYLCTKYYVKDGHIIIKTGFIFKSEKNMSLASITTFDVRQNIMERIFGGYTVSIDNGGSLGSAAANFELTLSDDNIKALRYFVEAASSHYTQEDELTHGAVGEIAKAEEKHYQYKMSIVDILFLALVQSKIKSFLQGLGMFIGLFFLVEQFGFLEYEDIFSFVQKEYVAIGDFSKDILLVYVKGFILIFILGAIFGLLKDLVLYYGFNLIDYDSNLKIRYGLINKREYTISKARISGIIMEQSLFMRLLGIATVKVIVVGYGNGVSSDSTEEAVLVPLLRLKNIPRSLENIVPEITSLDRLIKPEKRALHYFFIRISIFIALVLLSASIFASVFYIGRYMVWIPAAAILLYTLVGGLLSYFNGGYFIGLDTLIFSNGGFDKTIQFIKKESIESVLKEASVWKEKRGYISIECSYIASNMISTNWIENVPKDVYNKIEDIIEY